MARVKTSIHCKELNKRLMELKKHFVKSFNTKSTSSLTKRQIDLCRAFRVLCHAEIEAYFENVALMLINNAKESWDTKKEANITITSLFAQYEKIEMKASLNTKIHHVLSLFVKQQIKLNNGIKEKNIIDLFVPLGLDRDNFDAAWLATLDSYGNKRGTTAHTSAKTQQPIDVTTELNTLNYILIGIKDFEVLVTRIIA